MLGPDYGVCQCWNQVNDAVKERGLSEEQKQKPSFLTSIKAAKSNQSAEEEMSLKGFLKGRKQGKVVPF